MNICFVTSECVPFVKTGGLADVSGALPKALAQSGLKVKVFLPLYRQVDIKKHKLKKIPALSSSVEMDEESVSFDVWQAKLSRSSAEFYFIDCPLYFDRDSIYTEDADEGERFVLFQLAVLKTLQLLKWRPDVLHCNDWQTGLLPAFLQYRDTYKGFFKKTTTLMSIHNIGYQGLFGPAVLTKSGLPKSELATGGLFEFHGSFSFLKTGLLMADKVSTVSQSYAREIQTPEFGAGMETLLHQRSEDLVGILNGVDVTEWHPHKDELIPHPYSVENLTEKVKNKKKLLRYAELQYRASIPTVGIVTRLTPQKGLDLLVDVLDDIMEEHQVQFTVLGSGDFLLERFFRSAALSYRDRFFTYLGYNNELAHLITAGSDIFLMPSRYEPCGLNQMYSLNYGTVPIVRRTGGLADTVIDVTTDPKRGNGFTFLDTTPEALQDAIGNALSHFKNRKRWRTIMQRGMQMDFSWKNSAHKYQELYTRLK